MLGISLFILTGCSGVDPQEVVGVDEDLPLEESVYENGSDVWARDNFDLQAIGNVLEESENIEDFERRINTDNRFNNLDLNGDNYADYITVQEFEDQDDNQRGFSLFSKFDTNDVQEIASIIFDRDRIDQRGARVYIDGNEQIYGDNYDFEGNWLDKSLSIARYVFSDRDERYSSPYYYDNYPDQYTEYRVVETPVYRQRVQTYLVNPVIVKIDKPRKFKISSPYKGKSYDKIYAKLAKPNKQQIAFYKNKADIREDIREDRRDRREDRKNVKEDRRDKRLERREDKRENKQDKIEKRQKKREEGIEDRGDRSNKNFSNVKVKQKDFNKHNKKTDKSGKNKVNNNADKKGKGRS